MTSLRLFSAATLLLLSSAQVTQAAQSISYTYNAFGLIETIDGPRIDVSDVTSYTYTAQGLRSSITNALGHTTQITSYDSNNRPLQWTDANGLITQLSYTNAGELSQYTVSGQTTELHYDGVGNLIGILPPHGAWLYLQYNDARQLIQIEDIAGNTIVYTRDLAGNITLQQTKDAQGQLVYSQQQVFDELSRLIQTIRASGSSETYQYDNNDNLTQVIDAKNQSQSLAYDALNRLVTQTNALNDNTQYYYDAEDNLTQVIDPKGLITQYSYDAFGNQITQHSPDTGLTSYTYDNANNRINQTDARGISTQYSYDALNRLTSITYPNSSSSINYDVSYSYDTGAYAIGHLSRITDSSGSTEYAYNSLGELITQTQTLGSQSYITQYAYDNTGRLSTMTYPSGKVITYHYNTQAQITDITLDDKGQITTLMNSASYLPFGGLKQLTFGNGQLLSKSFDLNYQLNHQSLTHTDGQTVEHLQSINYSVDPLGNITQISNTADSLFLTQDYLFDYDALSRLISAQSNLNDYLYRYDRDGNRLQLTINGDIVDYTYPLSSNHLSGISGAMSQSLTYDAVGNLISTHTRDYTYGDNNRLVQVREGGSLIADYSYNANGQRVSKTRYLAGNSTQTTQQTTHFIYDKSGNLIAEHQGSGESLNEYVYVNGKRLALIASASETAAPTTGVILDNSDSSTVFAGDWTISTSVSGFEGENYQHHSANGASPDGLVIDNTDTSFSTTGTWTASTSVSGFEGTNYQHHFANGASPDGMVIDNTDAAFSTTGTWTASTSASGYEGINYQHHSANGASPDGLVIDNTDASFSTTGTWTASTSVSGYEGDNYQHHVANGASPDGLELDNSDSSVFTVGNWNNSTSASGFLGTNYQYAPAGTGTQSFTWTGDITTAGQYHVYAKWTASSNRASNAAYTITHSTGQSLVTQNQKFNGGQWNLLGTYTFNQSTTNITLTDDADGYVIADGIKLVPIDAAPNTATWTLPVPSDGNYTVYAKWTAGSNRASNAAYTINHTQGQTTTLQNQQLNGGQWNSLGQYHFTAGQTTVSLTDVADGYVIADSIKLVPEGALPNTATWTLTIPSDGNYTVYAKWTAGSNRASNSAYTINHTQGQTTTLQNQQLNGGKWNDLGQYSFTAGQTTVTLSDIADGYVIADSIKLVPEGALPNTATWTLTIPSDGNYTIYAKWTAGSNRASNATYTITHAAGDTTLTQNQQLNGGKWNDLGQYSFTAGQTTVTLSDIADGYVIADSIKLVPEGALPNSVTWNPGLVGTAEYDVYAKWTAGSNRASNAQYTITHAQGSDTIQTNQQLNGGQWNLLGTYTLDSLSDINLTDQGDGYVIADSIKLIPTGNSVTTMGGLYYIHTDHLDTPKLMTNTVGDVVWSSKQTPFGQMLTDSDPDGDGQHVNLNFRFPGQYFDKETGLYYNYFRYYDPELGRYITSDPIGLAGGINTYAYVGGNPLNWTDIFGLEKYLDLYVDLPGSGDDNETYEFNPFTQEVDVGHTFIGARDTDTGTSLILGKYPTPNSILNPLKGQTTSSGYIKDDTGTPYDHKVSRRLTDNQYNNFKQCMNTPSTSYDLDRDNCTDWSLKCAAKAGQLFTDHQGKWPGGGGSNPGMLGRELMGYQGGYDVFRDLLGHDID
jgi:RHS repeat-associated protein